MNSDIVLIDFLNRVIELVIKKWLRVWYRQVHPKLLRSYLAEEAALLTIDPRRDPPFVDLSSGLVADLPTALKADEHVAGQRGSRDRNMIADAGLVFWSCHTFLLCSGSEPSQ